MKKTRRLSEITAEITDQVKILEGMAEQVSVLGEQISEITNNLRQYNQDKTNTDEPHHDQYAREFADAHFHQQPAVRHSPVGGFAGRNPFSEMAAFKAVNIIPFPGQSLYTTQGNIKDQDSIKTKRILAVPEMLLPPGIHDFRPLLQRDGLILLAWDKRMTEMGERFTAYWVTSTGIPRYYASKHYAQNDFSSARPDHKSYAAEDGIEFFGQKAPDYLVHVAPELMMSNPRHRELRQAHINILMSQGYKVDYGYTYLLTKEKKRNLLHSKQVSRQSGLTGA